MVICSECGHQNRHDAACCLRCGSLLQYSTSVLADDSIEVSTPKDKFGNAMPEHDLELTFHIGTGMITLPFNKQAALVLGRQAAPDLRSTLIDPLQNRLSYSVFKGKPVVLREPVEFLSLLPFGADQLGVSRRHAILRHEPHYLSVEDLTSTNGTRLNGQRLLPGDKRLLRDGDELLLGGLSLTVTFNREAHPQPGHAEQTYPLAN